MKLLFRIALIIFSLASIACKQNSGSENPIKPTSQLPDSILLHYADLYYDSAEKITDSRKYYVTLNLHLNSLAIREMLLSNDIKLLNSYYRVGMLYWNDNKFDVADRYLENARRIAEKINTPTATLFHIYYFLASCKTEAKDFPTAVSLNQHLLHFIQEREPKNLEMIVDAYSQIGTIYYNSNQESKAIDNWLMALHLTPVENHAIIGRLYFYISNGHNELKQFEKSLEYINKSIRQELIVAGPESKSIADRYLHKAFTLLNLKKVDSVPYFLHRTLNIRKKIFGEKHSYTYGIKRGLGDFYYQIHQYDSAAFYHQQSLVSLIRKFNNRDLLANPEPDQDELNADLVQSLVKKGEAIQKLFEKDSSKIELLDLSLNTYILADSVFAGYRKNILHDDPIMQQMEGKMIPYSNMLNIALKLFKQKRASGYLEKSFQIMESSRAIVLQNALAHASVLGSIGISDSILNKAKGFSQIRGELLQKMNGQNLVQSEYDSLNEELLTANNREFDLLEDLKKSNPNYFSTKYERVPRIKELKRLLELQNSVYLEYMWGDSSIYTMLISKDTVIASSIPINKNLNKAFDEYIKEFRADPEGAFGIERYKSFCDNSSQLYDYLVNSLLVRFEPNTHLIISADGPLATIPFEALITSNPAGNEVNYHLPYLVMEHPISYAYSAGVLLKQSSHLREGQKLLAFGYAGGGPARASRTGLVNLPGTEKEILAIKDVMHNNKNQYKLQSEASESFFKRQVPDFDVVHLAVHGEGDTLNALNSRLIFRTENDTTEDGSLYAHELYNLNLSKLDLAVLSACESGVGKQQTGEGILSIARGFAYAGCPSLVISLWKIDDRTSAQVMKGFYNYLSQGEQLDLSLAKAKTDYIKGAGEFNSHPYYWAAFLQVGDVRKLDITKPNWWSWVLLGLGGVLSIYAIKIFRKKLN